MKNFGEINRALVAKKKFISIFVLSLFTFHLSLSAQSLLTPEQLAKRERNKNLTVKEWNTDDKTKPAGLTASRSMTTKDDVWKKSSTPPTVRNGASPVSMMT